MKEPARRVAALLCAAVTLGTPGAGQERPEPTMCIAAGDLDGDGAVDLVFGNDGLPDQLFYNDGKGRFDEVSPAIVTGAARSTCAVALADVDGDSDLDVLSLSRDGSLRLLRNGGSRQFTAEEILPPTAGKGIPPTTMATGDLDGDGDPDLVLGVLGGANRLLLNDGKGAFGPGKLPPDDEHTAVIRVGDVDGDGDLDVLFGNRRDAKGRGGQNVLLLNDGKAGFTPGALPREETSTSALLLLDLDGDERPDILKGVLGKRGGRPRQYRNAGGTFKPVRSSDVPNALIDMRVAVGGDLDGDGDADVLLCVTGAPLRLWTNEGRGRLTVAPDDRVAAIDTADVTDLLLADLDRDGDLDVVVAREGATNLILDNTGGKLTERPGNAFLNMKQAARLAHIRAVEKKYGFVMADPATAGGGRYRLRAQGRKDLTDAKVAAAIASGIRWLVTHQHKSGHWDADGFMSADPRDDRCTGAGKPVYDVAVTGLALLVLLADGHTAFLGEHCESVDRGLQYLRGSVKADGRVGPLLHDHAYTQCIAALALCEGYGLSGDPRLQKAAQAAVDYLGHLKHPNGGWGYTKNPEHGDTPITVWVAQVYRAARDFGIAVPADAAALAKDWLDRITVRNGIAGYKVLGEIGSRKPGDHAQRWPLKNDMALTAAALYARYLIGARRKESRVLGLAAKHLVRVPPKYAPGYTNYYYWFYGTYALLHHGGDEASKWNAILTPLLLKAQCATGSAAGSFDPDGVWGEDGGRVCSTALALLCLQVPYRHVAGDAR